MADVFFLLFFNLSLVSHRTKRERKRMNERMISEKWLQTKNNVTTQQRNFKTKCYCVDCSPFLVVATELSTLSDQKVLLE